MLRFLTAGESHGPLLTAVIDGFPAGFSVDFDKINYQLERRQKGYGRGGRMKIESDRVEVVSGIRGGVTMGGPITFQIHNKDWKNWTKIMDPVDPPADDLNLKESRLAYETTRPRPGHADLAGGIKYGHHDLRNVLERASARETAARVALGALTRLFLEDFGANFASHVVSLAGVDLPEGYDQSDLQKINQLSEASEVRCIDSDTADRMREAIKKAKNSRDSVGGIAEIIVSGLPVGLGSYSQWSRRLDARLAAAMMSIPSVKGVEIGLGFACSKLRGSQVHDQIGYDPKAERSRKRFVRETNNAGGIEGGITNGEDLVVRVAAKPISTLNRPLKTVDVKTKKPAEAMVERTDNCVVPAIAVIGEAMAATVLADCFLEKFGADNMTEIRRNYDSYLDASY